MLLPSPLRCGVCVSLTLLNTAAMFYSGLESSPPVYSSYIYFLPSCSTIDYATVTMVSARSFVLAQVRFCSVRECVCVCVPSRWGEGQWCATACKCRLRIPIGRHSWLKRQLHWFYLTTQCTHTHTHSQFVVLLVVAAKTANIGVVQSHKRAHTHTHTDT